MQDNYLIQSFITLAYSSYILYSTKLSCFSFTLLHGNNNCNWANSPPLWKNTHSMYSTAQWVLRNWCLFLIFELEPKPCFLSWSRSCAFGAGAWSKDFWAGAGAGAVLFRLESEKSSSSGSDLYKSKQFLDILNLFLFPRIPFYLINSVKAAKGQTIKRLWLCAVT